MQQEERKLAQHLIQRVCERGAGRNESECQLNYPHDMYFIGNLRPQEDLQSDLPNSSSSHLDELLSKLAPAGFGGEVCLHPKNDKLTIDIEVWWACYYRVFPTWLQQCQHQKQQIAESEEGEEVSTEDVNAESKDSSVSHIGVEDPITPSLKNNVASNEDDEEEDASTTFDQDAQDELVASQSPEVVESVQDRRRKRIPKDSLFIRFRKVPCHSIGQVIVKRHVTGRWLVETADLHASLDKEVLRAQQVALDDPEHVRTDKAPHEKIRVPETALATEKDYQAFLKNLRTEVKPEWRWRLQAETRTSSVESPNDVILFFEFVNASPKQTDQSGYDNQNVEPFLFDVRASFAFQDGEIRPFELDLAPRGFRYNRDLWGRGFNCALERMPGQPNILVTTHVPVYRQMRYLTREDPPATFAALAQDPLPTLNTILTTMESYLSVWKQKRQHYIDTYPNWESLFGAEFDRDRQRFEEEVERFRRGCQLIRENADILLAFKLTNETFRRAGDHPQSEKRKQAWRLFQIVFLVSQITGIASLASGDPRDLIEREAVDIIYFPTGGGKTEAYLATIVFHCFFDRLRGKAAGVTAWTRFPLRLLTLQQTQRVADVIGIAELVRQEQKNLRLNSPDVDKFAVGYFVGEGGSPNAIEDPNQYRYANEKMQTTWSSARDPKARQNWQRVTRCPSCHTQTVEVDFEPEKLRLVHRCSKPTCSFPGGEIPVYVVDYEIYRYLPSVIVGTIDKLASVGNQRMMAQIFGQVDGRCSKHGYYKGKCCQKSCNDRRLLKAGTPRGLSGPTLFVQDELHLLKEGLGTFDAHYESFIQRLRQEFSQKDTLKVIASSATIEAFDRQVEHLYGRDRTKARIFPGPGPTLGESYYALTLDNPQRLYVGLIPHNKTIFNTILELLEFYHAEIQRLLRLPLGVPNPYGGTIKPGTIEWQKLLDLYLTSLTYFLSGLDLSSIHTDLEADTNQRLQRDGLSALEIAELTGDTNTDEVTRILEKLEHPPQKSPSLAVLATNMVSHGVDVDRLNAMFFYGMPRQNAEYIQASSRVGRSHVGIVFCCLHPMRERDRSHYAYFQKYHQFLGQLVEPVAINRWAKFSIRRTLPGLFMSVLLQLIANRFGGNSPNRYYMLDFVKQRISEGSLRADQFIPLLEEAYLVDTPTTPGELAFHEEIPLRVRQFLDQIIGAGLGVKFVSQVIIPRPMNSLRDVDEALDIELDDDGTQWARRERRS